MSLHGVCQGTACAGADLDQTFWKDIKKLRWCTARSSPKLIPPLTASYKLEDKFYKPHEVCSPSAEGCIFGVSPLLDGHPDAAVKEHLAWESPGPTLLGKQLDWLRADTKVGG